VFISYVGSLLRFRLTLLILIFETALNVTYYM